MRLISDADCSTVMCTFRSLYVGEVAIVTVSSSTPAASASSAPRTFGTSRGEPGPGRWTDQAEHLGRPGHGRHGTR